MTGWERWLYRAVAAAVGGASNAVTLIVLDPLQFNLFQGGATKLAMGCSVSALVALAMYLKQEPLPQDMVAVGLDASGKPFVR